MHLGREKPSEAMPDYQYFIKVIRRNLLPSVISTIVITLGGVIAIYKARDLYQSSVTVLYDRKDGFLDNNLEISDSSTDSVERSFELSFRDPQFASSIVESLELKTHGRLAAYLQSLKLFQPETAVQRLARVGEWYGQRVTPSIKWGTGVLTLDIALDETPERAQELAAASVNKFIREEMQKNSQRLDRRLQLVNQALNDARSHLAEIQGAYKEVPESQNQSEIQAAPLSFRDREAQYLDKIKLAETEISELNEARTRRQTILESELQRLSARLMPNHPELAVKRSEIQDFMNSSDSSLAAVQRLNQLRRELWILRSQLAHPRTGSDRDGVSLEEQSALARIAELTEKFELLSLEKTFVDEQIAQPEKMSRFRMVKAPTFEPRPIKRRRLQTMFGVASAAVLGFFLTILLRERSNPLARDDWRIMRTTGIPVLSQISAEGLKSFPNISPENATAMRAQLWSNSADTSLATRVLLAYRRLELSIATECVGKSVCLLGGGNSDALREATDSLFAIIAQDQNRDVIVLDFSLPSTEPGSADHQPDLSDTLLDLNKLAGAIIPKSSMRPSDLLRIRRPLTAQRIRAINEENINRLIVALAERYDRIFVRSMPDHFFIENYQISQATSDTILIIDGRSTSFAALHRAIDQCNGNNLRGIFVVGS